MSLNSSSATSHLSPANTILGHMQVCWSSRVGALHITALTITNNLFFLPLYIFILYLSYKRWRRQRNGAGMNPSDLFTCHMVIIELINVLGNMICCCGVHADVPEMVIAGIYCFVIAFSGQMLLHTLTCFERYLAVVHPITYLSLKKLKGISIRNLILGCVWLLCIAGLSFLSFSERTFNTTVMFLFVPFVVVVISFCSISVLCTLIRPGPGEGGRNRQQVDQSKLRAFYTITAILGVLLLRFGATLLSTAVYKLWYMSDDDRCGVWLSDIWFSFPSSLVLPLLFLLRAGKLPCCRSAAQRPN